MKLSGDDPGTDDLNADGGAFEFGAQSLRRRHCVRASVDSSAVSPDPAITLKRSLTRASHFLYHPFLTGLSVNNDRAVAASGISVIPSCPGPAAPRSRPRVNRTPERSWSMNVRQDEQPQLEYGRALRAW